MVENDDIDDYNNKDDDNNYDDSNNYDDFLTEEIPSKDEGDSFNEDMLKIYEDHKKNVNAKANELTNMQRPLSSYQRPIQIEKKEFIINNSEEDDNLYGNFDDFEDKECSQEMQQFQEILNNFKIYLKTNVTYDNFIENLGLYLNFADFKNLLKQIKFECSEYYIKMLFSNIQNDDFIDIMRFVNLEKLEFKEFNLQIDDSRESDFNSNRFEENEIKTKNDEFNNLHSEILELVKKDLLNKNDQKIKKVKKINFKTKITKITNEIKEEKEENDKSEIKHPIDLGKLLKENNFKLREKEKKMKEDYNNRQSNIVNECLIKMEEANLICNKLKINKTFSKIYVKDVIKCQIFDTNKQMNVTNPRIVEMKTFLSEWRYLKRRSMNDSSNGLKSPKQRASSAISVLQSNTVPLEDKEIQNQIKNLLVSTMKLKLKLKEQLTSLKTICKIDENLILNSLKLN